MSTTLILTTVLFCADGPPAARVSEPPVARCCDCCTCPDGRCTCAFPGECLYAAAYRVCVRDGRPLVVFVGRSEVAVAGCRTVAVPQFPGAIAPAVVVGVPDGAGAMDRMDLPGTADDAAIRARITANRRSASGRSFPFPTTRRSGLRWSW